MTAVNRSAGAIFAAAALAGMIVAIAIGQAGAQPVNPVPPPPAPPAVNPSAPNVVPQPPYVPASPSTPGAVPGSSSVPDIATPAAPASPHTVDESTKVSPSPTRVHRHASVRWSRHHRRWAAARVVGPSYYPGLGEFYPPYPDVCHFRQVWTGPYLGGWVYTCS